MQYSRFFICAGWLQTHENWTGTLHGYWNYRDELVVEDGRIILEGSRIVVPKAVFPAVLEQLHYANRGIDKFKLRVKFSVFWD